MHDPLQIRAPRLPPQHATDALGLRHQVGGVSFAPARHLHVDIARRHLPHRVHYLEDGVSRPRAQIQKVAVPTGGQVIEGEDVSAAQIGHVYVVSHRGAVHGRIIVAKDLEVGSLAEGDFQAEGNQMGLGVVVLPAALGSP